MNRIAAYEPKKPKFRAVQWDGTIDGTWTVIDLLNAVTPRNSATVTSRLSHGAHGENQVYKSLRMTAVEGEDLIPGDWLILDHDNEFRVMSNERFTRDYQLAVSEE